MKIRFTVELFDKTFEEVIEVDEKKLVGEGYFSRNTINNMLSNWVDAVTDSYYQILDDRFDDETENMPYVDWVVKQRLGWE